CFTPSASVPSITSRRCGNEWSWNRMRRRRLDGRVERAAGERGDGGAARSGPGGVRDLARGDRDRERRTYRERILEDEGALMRNGGRRPLLIALAILGLVALAAPGRATDEAPAGPITTAHP